MHLLRKISPYFRHFQIVENLEIIYKMNFQPGHSSHHTHCIGSGGRSDDSDRALHVLPPHRHSMSQGSLEVLRHVSKVRGKIRFLCEKWVNFSYDKAITVKCPALICHGKSGKFQVWLFVMCKICLFFLF